MSARPVAIADAAPLPSLAAQSIDQLGGPSSVLARQKQDHVELDHLLRRLGEVLPVEQGKVLLDIYRLVFPHAFAEETVLWPVIRKVLPDGEALTLKVEREHQEINELVTRLEFMEAGEPERQNVLDRVVGLLRQDVRDEEDTLLPRLQNKLPTSQLQLLGTAWELVRQIAPTRAHPIVSRRPPGNVVSALPLSAIDRARDLVDSALNNGPEAAAPPLRTLNSALAMLAHGVERLPGMQLGEAPSTAAAKDRGLRWGAVVLVGVATILLLARASASDESEESG